MRWLCHRYISNRKQLYSHKETKTTSDSIPEVVFLWKWCTSQMNTTLKRYYGKRRMVEVVVWWMWLQCYSDFKKGEMYSELPYMWEVYPTGLIRKSVGPIVGMQPTSKQITKTIDDNPLILSLVWQLTQWPYYMRNVNYLWKSLRIKLTESIKCFIQKKKKM